MDVGFYVIEFYFGEAASQEPKNCSKGVQKREEHSFRRQGLGQDLCTSLTAIALSFLMERLSSLNSEVQKLLPLLLCPKCLLCRDLFSEFLLYLPSSRFDAKLMSQIRNVTHTESRSLFHVPATSPTPPPMDSGAGDTTRQFGVHLSQLKDHGGGGAGQFFLPLVVKSCVEYLEKEGLTVMGIFRRAPNNVKVRVVKRQFDLGMNID